NPGVGGLQLGTGQSVVHRRGTAASVALQMHAQQAELAELLAQLADRQVADLEPLRDVGDHVLGAELPDRVAHRDLIAGQRCVQAEGVFSVERRRLVSTHRRQPATASDAKTRVPVQPGSLAACSGWGGWASTCCLCSCSAHWDAAATTNAPTS